MNDSIKVLMVDDEEQFRATTRKLLTRKGFDTLLAGSGEEALEQLEKQPDVVILDIKMPGMDGHETLREIRKRTPDTPVIMLTGHGDLPSAMEARRSGAFDYLSKPCDIDLLAAKISDAFKTRQKGARPSERKIREAMIPFEEYASISSDQTIQEAIRALKDTFASRMSTSRLMETGHRSLLVLGANGEVQGVMTIKNLLEAIMPAYLSAPKPSMADSIQYSPMFWSGMFTLEVRKLASKRVGEVMSPRPSTIDADSNLMEAAFLMVTQNERRLLVLQGTRPVGVIREQDLFFEMARIQQA